MQQLYENRFQDLAPLVKTEGSRKDRFYYKKLANTIATQVDLHLPEASIEERLLTDGNNPSDFNVERFEEIYNKYLDVDALPEVFQVLSEIESSFDCFWSRDEMAKTIDTLGHGSLETHSARINRRNLATLEISAERLRELPTSDRERILSQLAVMRSSWYLYYGFLDTRLLATYLAYGREQGLSIVETLTRWVDPTDYNGKEVYYVTLAGKCPRRGREKKFRPYEVLGHIGIVQAVDNAHDRMDDQFDHSADLLHIDHVHIDKDRIADGERTILELNNKPTRVGNVLEVTRFVKSPFLRTRQQLAAMWLLTERAMRTFNERGAEEGLVVVMDVDDSAAGKTFNHTGLGGTRGSSNGTTSATTGLLYPRWEEDPNNVGRGGPTLPVAFTELDLQGVNLQNTLRTDPRGYMADILRLVNTGSPIVRVMLGLGALDRSIQHLIRTTDSPHVLLRGQNGVRISRQVGPEELSHGSPESAYERLTNMYGENLAHYLPLPAGYMFDASNISEDVVERVTFPEQPRKLTDPGVSLRATLHSNGQLTPLGNRYHPITEQLHDATVHLDTTPSTDKSTLTHLLARGGYLPIINEILSRAHTKKERFRGIVPGWLARYVLPPAVPSSRIRQLTGTSGKLETQRSLGGNSVFICAGLGTGGMSPFGTIRSALPAAGIIAIDPGVIEPDNTGHQESNLVHVGASKVAMTIDRAMSNGPVAPWGSEDSALGCLYGINRPYTSELDPDLEKLFRLAGEGKSVVLVDEIDVTDSPSIQAKVDFHRFAIKLAQNTGRPISVVGGLDLGQGALWRGHWVYDANSEPFYGLLNVREGMEPFVENVSPMILLAPLFLQDATLPPEMQLLLLQLASDGSLDGISQTIFSSTQSGTHIGLSAVLSSIMQNADWPAVEMRGAIDTVYVTNPLEAMLSGGDRSTLRVYRNAGGYEGLQLLSYILHLSSLIYDTRKWPTDMKSRLQRRMAYLFKRLQASRDSF